MQLYAFDQKQEVISAKTAVKHINYSCLECKTKVRKREGPYRQPHFYHLDPPLSCRQHQKGLIHLQLQAYFLKHLPIDDCVLEYRFPTIQRIADVAWLSQKIVFEIQYSPISGQEVIERNQDYAKIGWKVVWILHDHRYNKVRLSLAELVLLQASHFFTNMDEQGKGIIYDQFQICYKGIRKVRLPPIALQAISLRAEIKFNKKWPLALLNQRIKNGCLSFAGDLYEIVEDPLQSAYLQTALQAEKRYDQSFFSWKRLIKHTWPNFIKQIYLNIFRFVLEKMCH